MKLSGFYWPITFFSTAFGAGIFFLPQSIGPVVIGGSYFSLFIFFSMLISLAAHYLFYAFISSTKEKDFFISSTNFIGRKVSFAIFFFFIVSMVIIVLINFISLINALLLPFDDDIISRCYTSFLVSFLLSFIWFKFDGGIEVFISRIALVAIVMVGVVSIFFLLNGAGEKEYYNHISPGSMMSVLPIFLFTFNFTPCIQRFARSTAKPNAGSIVWGSLIIMCFIFLVVVAISRGLTFSDVLTISNNNVDSLSFAATIAGNDWIWIASIFLILLITSGAYLGTLTGVVDGLVSFGVKDKRIIILYNIVLCFFVGVFNPSVIKLISKWSMPIVVITVYFIPALFFIFYGSWRARILGGVVFSTGIAVMLALPL